MELLTSPCLPIEYDALILGFVGMDLIKNIAVSPGDAGIVDLICVYFHQVLDYLLGTPEVR